ncbi:type VI secretion system tube protein Hcp [Luteolibacter sp. GHJ8]|uniref:Type VI secretion system tube protein Hcp n=1 Tax=Luteolibacter rhizosphaerae TaxID=2989719 RepID=A0ABT3G4B2_9BACT|nr:type VI secretion system tube protein Hcp [Luteolibacter rhizosphaerae]MCW1914682.1 type VI secretion system tube protein Hcp [Luteolibacter rhizosphaerae]
MKLRPSIGSTAAAFAVMLLAVNGAQAAIRAWLDFDGTIPGESRDAMHRNWIDITGFEFSGEERAAPQGFGLLKLVDKASPKLFQATTTGAEIPKATLDLVRSTAEGNETFCRIRLEGIFLTSQTISGNGEAPTETVGLAFKKITYSYFEPVRGTQFYSTFNFENNTGSSGTGNPPDSEPPNPDSDSDGIPDAWEATYGLSIGTNDANADPDGDGLTNREEYLLGTHPKSGASFFKANVVLGNGNAQVSWNAKAGATYVVEWSPNLTSSFSTVATVTASSGSGTATVPAGGTIGFYRVRLQP